MDLYLSSWNKLRLEQGEKGKRLKEKSVIIGIKYQVGKRERAGHRCLVLFSLSFDKGNKSKLVTLPEPDHRKKAENYRHFTKVAKKGNPYNVPI